MPSERIRSSTAHFALEEWERAVGTAAVTGYEDEVGDFGGGDGLSEVRAVSGLALRSGAMGRSGGEGGVGALGGGGQRSFVEVAGDDRGAEESQAAGGRRVRVAGHCADGVASPEEQVGDPTEATRAACDEDLHGQPLRGRRGGGAVASGMVVKTYPYGVFVDGDVRRRVKPFMRRVR
jgi:hypothetical protein